MRFVTFLRAIRDSGIYSSTEWQEYLTYFDLNQQETEQVNTPETTANTRLAAIIKTPAGSRPRLVEGSRPAKFREIDALRRIGATTEIGLVSGCFDLLHLGHLRSFTAARTVLLQRGGTALVAAVLSDQHVRAKKGPDRPILSLAERLEILGRVRAITYVTALTDADCLGLLRDVIPRFVFKRSADLSQPIVVEEIAMARMLGVEVVLLPPEQGHTRSTTELIRVVKEMVAAEAGPW